MRLWLFALAFPLAFAACGSQSPAPEKAAPPPETRPDNVPLAAAPDAAPPPDDCANACTEIAVCWEEVNEGREYTQGGNCTSACDDATPDEQKAFFECVSQGRSECSKMVACG
jgi:Cys-rich protein (TIGR04453 family)